MVNSRKTLSCVKKKKKKTRERKQEKVNERKKDKNMLLPLKAVSKQDEIFIMDFSLGTNSMALVLIGLNDLRHEQAMTL